MWQSSWCRLAGPLLQLLHARAKRYHKYPSPCVGRRSPFFSLEILMALCDPLLHIALPHYTRWLINDGTVPWFPRDSLAPELGPSWEAFAGPTDAGYRFCRLWSMGDSRLPPSEVGSILGVFPWNSTRVWEQWKNITVQRMCNPPALKHPHIIGCWHFDCELYL